MAQSPSLYEPESVYVNPVTRAWATTGNTDTVTDESCVSGSLPVVVPTSAYAGRWYISNITPTSSSTSASGVVTITPGTFTVTSSSSETATTTTYKYYLT